MMNNVVKLIVIALVLALCIIALGITIANAFEGKNFVFAKGLTYPDASSYSAGNQEYDAQSVSTVFIDYEIGEINLIKQDTNIIKVEETGAEGEKNTVHTRLHSGKLSVQYGQSRIAFCETLPKKTLNIYIPNSLDRLQIESTSGKIVVDGVVAKSIDVDVTSAYVEIKNSNAKTLEVEATSGDIAISGDYENAYIDVTSGNVTYSGGANSLDIEATSGDIAVSGSFGDIKSDTTSGCFAFNGTADEMDLEATSGNFNISGTVRIIEIEATSGNTELKCAPAVLALEVTSGDVNIILPNDTEGLVATHESVSGDMTVILKDGSQSGGRRYSDGKGAEHVFGFETTSGDVTIVFKSAEYVN